MKIKLNIEALDKFVINWKKYKDIGRLCFLPHDGRELINEQIFWTEKRDGQNISFWVTDENKRVFSFHGMKDPTKELKTKEYEKNRQNQYNSVISTKEYPKLMELVKEYPNHIFYCEHICKGKTPTKLEPPHKIARLVLIDIYDKISNEFVSYNFTYQMAIQNKIPITKLIEIQIPKSLDEIYEKRDELYKWCKRHRREGVVGKTYYTKPQIFFKEKIDLPKIRKPIKLKPNEIQRPKMPDEKIKSAIKQAKYEIEKNGGDFKNPKDSMPIIAKYISTEAKEHHYAIPVKMFSFYQFYLEGKL